MVKSQRPNSLRRSFINTIFLHELSDAKHLFEAVAKDLQEQSITIPTAFVEKDYWLMHCLWGLQQQGYHFALKGGTSLAKGFGIIERFSEDIDIQIFPNADESVKTAKNHDKPVHIESRRKFFAKIQNELKVTSLSFQHDSDFDDPTGKVRNIGIRGSYQSFYEEHLDLKSGILLEIGFDQITPNIPCTITSWAYEKAKTFSPELIDNRAIAVNCYCPEYTFVEKLQTISTKYRQQQESGSMPTNFLRHYYDVYKLLENDRVLKFIGTSEYFAHKNKRFRTGDEKDISKNDAFIIADPSTRKLYSNEFEKKAAIYFGKQPKLEEILAKLSLFADKL